MMMRKKFKQHKTAAVAVAAALCVTAAAGTLAVYGQNAAEKQVKETAEEKLSQEEAVYIPWDENTLYKETVENQDIVKQVCEKYGLDPNSATMKDITREMRNYEEALWLLDEMGEKPLLMEKGEGMDSLETYIGDVYAFDGGKQVLESYCREHGLHAKSARIKDLTAEDLVAIGEIAYNTSEHPKN
ncbi:hypothetical protein AALH30_14745 [Blautia pseudococcoides]|uniref:hypothetical protein n=1 Tax=Blautia pseudococcoides TaxID=1796616 RepID=UPI00148AFABF|nr:hypothetical protein [Blautia pseudococcoides]QJU15893.1 hypothetical protein HL650_16530 [Blautia pseudococcoides]